MALFDNLMDVQDKVIHHSANLAAVTIPVMSAALHGPQILTYGTASAGLVWYAILITERLCFWLKRLSEWRKGRTKKG